MSVGTVLRHARENAGLSAEQIGERTKIPLYKIDALENGNFERLPEGIYLDGIVRAYAREVGLDPEPLVELVRHQRAALASELDTAPADLDTFHSEEAFKADVFKGESPTERHGVLASPPPDIDTIDRAWANARPHVLADDKEPPVLAAPHEPSTPVRKRGRALPVIALLAAIAIGAYVLGTRLPFQSDADRDVAARASRQANPDDHVLGDATSASPRATEVTPDASRPQDRIARSGERTSTAGADRRPDPDPDAVADQRAAPRVENTPPARSERAISQPAPKPAAPAEPRGRAAPPATTPAGATATAPAAATAPPAATGPATTASPTTPAPARAEKSAGTDPSIRDVSGSWTLATQVESSSVERFNGLRLGYEIQLQQAGSRVTGSGRKITENGAGIGSRAQTPILVAGTVDGDRLTLTFTERGTRRPSEGKFVLLLDESGTMHGRFSSDAAKSSGTVEARRVTQ